MAAQHGYISKDHVIYSQGIDVPSGSSELVISKNISVSDATSVNFAMFINVENVSIPMGEEIKFSLQKHNGIDWCDVGDPQATVKVTLGDGTYCILLNDGVEAEALVLPLTNLVRLVADSDANSSASVKSITVFSRV